MTFTDIGFDERILKGVSEAGFESPLPVQAQCFNLLIEEKRDIYAQSQTGTGKTAAFLLGIFQLIVADEKYRNEKALIVVPTRELAVQIEREGKTLGKYLDLKIGAVFGGVGYKAQEDMLEGNVDILIGTPGRLLDFGKQKKIDFKNFGFFVVDEADRLFDMGFLPDIQHIFKNMRPPKDRKTLLFSATMNSKVGNIAWEHMDNPGEVIIEPEKVMVDTVTQELYHVGKDEKMQVLLGILGRDNPNNVVIFTNTKHSAWEVAKRLKVNGYDDVVYIMGDLNQTKRLKIVDDVKKGIHKFLVATDVAARGLHIDDLELVINYDVPLEPESYVHRVGRTARAGKKGKTITLACEEYVYGLSPIEKLLGVKIPVSWTDNSLVVEDKSVGMRFPPQDRYREIGGEKSPVKNSRDSRSRNSNNRKPSRPSGDSRPPRRELNNESINRERAVKVQSAVSSIAGGDINDVPKSKKSPSPRRSRSTNSSPDPSIKKSPQKNVREKEVRSRKPDSKSIDSKSKVDDRLAYYRKKYGEDFQMNGKASSGKVKQDKKKTEKKGSILSRFFKK